jgi:hypothetical protein
MYTVEDINKAKQYLSDNGYGSGSSFTLNTVANLMAEWAAKNCSIPAVIKSVCEKCKQSEQYADTPLCKECLLKLYDEQTVL